MKKHTIFWNAYGFFVIIILGMLSNCARLGSPVGGDKDTIAPNFLRAYPDSFANRVALDLKQIRLDFDEYIDLKDLQKNLVISPNIQLTKVEPGQFASKYIVLQWKDSLKANTTYNFNFGNAIVDHHEKNLLPYFQYVFTTGQRLDSLGISGNASLVIDAKNNKESNVLVGIYPYQDSIDYRKKPPYLSRIDEDGYFELNYLKSGQYELIAFNDANANGIYDNPKESVGFLEKTIELKQIQRNLRLDLSPSYISEKYKEIKPMAGGILFQFEGKPEKINIKPVDNPIEEYKVIHRPFSDSAMVYFPTKKEYEKQGAPMKWAYQLNQKSDTVSVFYRSVPSLELSISNLVGEKIVPKSPFVIQANLPISQTNVALWKLSESDKDIAFKVNVSKDNPHLVTVEANYQPEKKYKLIVPKESISSFYYSNQKGVQFEFQVAAEEDFGQLTVQLLNAPECSFWAVLTDSNGKIISRYLKNLGQLKYSYLKPSTYELKIIEDKNENKKWDGSQFAKRIPAEKIYFYHKKISIRPLWEMNESWDLSETKIAK